MTNPANNESPQDRIIRLESLMVQLGTISQQRSQQVDDHETRIQRLEALNLTMGELVTQHGERMNALNAIAAQHEERMNSLAAAIERFDHLMDYLMRRDGGDRPGETQT